MLLLAIITQPYPMNLSIYPNTPLEYHPIPLLARVFAPNLRFHSDGKLKIYVLGSFNVFSLNIYIAIRVLVNIRSKPIFNPVLFDIRSKLIYLIQILVNIRNKLALIRVLANIRSKLNYLFRVLVNT